MQEFEAGRKSISDLVRLTRKSFRATVNVHLLFNDKLGEIFPAMYTCMISSGPKSSPFCFLPPLAAMLIRSVVSRGATTGSTESHVAELARFARRDCGCRPDYLQHRFATQTV